MNRTRNGLTKSLPHAALKDVSAKWDQRFTKTSVSQIDCNRCMIFLSHRCAVRIHAIRRPLCQYLGCEYRDKSNAFPLLIVPLRKGFTRTCVTNIITDIIGSKLISYSHRRRRINDVDNVGDFNDDDAEDDDEDDDDIEFYPIRKTLAANVRHELSDTFSLQEMTIVGTDEDDEGDDDNNDNDFGGQAAARKLKGSNKRTSRIANDDDNAAEDDDEDDDDDDSQTLEFLTPQIVGGGGGIIGGRLFGHCTRLICCWNKRRI